VTLPKISDPPTATILRDRALAMMNGESRGLSETDRERQEKLRQLRRSVWDSEHQRTREHYGR
jgi:hypothetical protein